jgi:hypothetical protein
MKIIEKLKEIFKKTKKALAIGGTVATIGLATGCSADKDIDTTDNNVKTEESSFKDDIHVDVEDLETTSLNKTEEKVEELENKDDLLNFLKDLYIEEYENKTGDTTLDTSDIKIIEENNNYIYQNTQTGEFITHDELPAQTEQMMKENNISYTIKEDVDVYQVKNNDDEIIDAMVVDEQKGPAKYIKAIPGNSYNEMKDYESTLTDLGEVISTGLRYWEFYDQSNNQVVKKQFIEALNKFEKQNTNTKDEEYEMEQ